MRPGRCRSAAMAARGCSPQTSAVTLHTWLEGTPAVRMLDSIVVANLPPGAPAYLGYVDGNWPTYHALKARFPHAHVLSMAVFATGDAEGCDREPGDLTAGQVAGWVRRQLTRGVHRPVVYASADNMNQVLDAITSAGLHRSQVRLLSAHYTGQAHVCGPRPPGCGYVDSQGRTVPACDGTQWTDQASGENGSHIDESLLHNDFFAPPKPPARILEDPVLLKPGAGSVTPIAMPVTATALRLVAGTTAEVKVEFHGHPATTKSLSWAQGSQSFTAPKNIHAAKVTRVDSGTGDVSVAVE